MAGNKEMSLKDLVKEFVNQSGKQQLFADRMVIENWPDYVGSLFAQYTTCLSLKNGILKVRVPNAALRFELTGQKNQIIQRINADYSVPVVNDIMFL